MWRRVCVDLGEEGTPLGWSISWRDDDGMVLEMLTGPVGPFDRARDAFDEACSQTMRQGQLEL